MKILSTLCGLSAFLSFAKLGECSQFTSCQGDDSNLISSAELNSESQATLSPAELNSGFQVNRSPAELNCESQATLSPAELDSGSLVNRSPAESNSEKRATRTRSSSSSSSSGYEDPQIVFTGLKNLNTLLKLQPETHFLFLRLEQLEKFIPREGLELGLKFISSDASIFNSARSKKSLIKEAITEFSETFERKTGKMLKHCLVNFHVNKKVQRIFRKKGITLHRADKWFDNRYIGLDFDHLSGDSNTNDFFQCGSHISGKDSNTYSDNNETLSLLKDGREDVEYDLLSDFNGDAIFNNIAEPKA